MECPIDAAIFVISSIRKKESRNINSALFDVVEALELDAFDAEKMAMAFHFVQYNSEFLTRRRVRKANERIKKTEYVDSIEGVVSMIIANGV